jgi:hypothetical protein
LSRSGIEKRRARAASSLAPWTSRFTTRSSRRTTRRPPPDLDAVFAQLQTRDADIVQEPADQPYGIRDCAVRDPAGNLIRINEVR